MKGSATAEALKLQLEKDGLHMRNVAGESFPWA